MLAYGDQRTIGKIENMYFADIREAQLLLSYSDVFPGEIPNLEEEIPKLNMHKAISIICELIRIRDARPDEAYHYSINH